MICMFFLFIETAESLVWAEQASEGTGSCSTSAAIGQGILNLYYLVKEKSTYKQIKYV